MLIKGSLQPRPQCREDSEEEDDDDDDDDENDEDYGGRRRGIDHANRPKRAAAKQAEQQLKAASVKSLSKSTCSCANPKPSIVCSLATGSGTVTKGAGWGIKLQTRVKGDIR